MSRPTPKQNINLLRSVARTRLDTINHLHATYGAHVAKLHAEVTALKRRIRIAKRALRKSTKYEPWDDFEWTAAIALDLRRKDFERRPVPSGRRTR